MKKLFRNLMLVAVAALGVASCADVPPPFVEPGGGESGGDDTPTVDLKGTGSATDLYNVAAALNLITALADDVQSDEQYYVTGIVSEIKEYSTQYGNASFVITDEGTGNELMFWRGYYLNNEKFTAETNPIAIGDSVVIYGYYVNYKGNTPETVQNKAYVYYHKSNGGTSETLNTPIVPEEGNLLVNGNFEGWTNGLPTHWASASSASSATLDCSTDAHGGSYAVVVKGASTNKRLAYKEMTLAAGDYTMSFYAKAVSGEASVRPGYAVVVGGSLSGDSYQYADYVNGITNAEWMQVTHSFTLEASTTLCLVVMNPKSTGTDVLVDDFKLTTTNGGTEDGGEEETPGEAKGDGSLENPFNAAAALEYTAALPADQATSEKFYVKGIVCESNKMDISTQYKNATFHISEDGTASAAQFYIFRTKGLNGADITSEDDVQVGDEVIVYASLVNYKGNTPETAQGGIIYAQKRNGVDLNPGEGGDNGEGEGGGNEGDDNNGGTTSEGITVNGTTILLTAGGVTAGSQSTFIDLNAQGYENGKDVAPANVDGCTVTFGAGTNATNSPKFYDKTMGVRMYANNTVTFTAEKTIATITLECDSYSGTDYVGNETRTLEVNNNVFLLTNAHTATSGGVQMRIKTVKFTFAE